MVYVYKSVEYMINKYITINNEDQTVKIHNMNIIF